MIYSKVKGVYSIGEVLEEMKETIATAEINEVNMVFENYKKALEQKGLDLDDPFNVSFNRNFGNSETLRNYIDLVYKDIMSREESCHIGFCDITRLLVREDLPKDKKMALAAFMNGEL